MADRAPQHYGSCRMGDGVNLDATESATHLNVKKITTFLYSIKLALYCSYNKKNDANFRSPTIPSKLRCRTKLLNSGT